MGLGTKVGGAGFTTQGGGGGVWGGEIIATEKKRGGAGGRDGIFSRVGIGRGEKWFLFILWLKGGERGLGRRGRRYPQQNSCTRGSYCGGPGGTFLGKDTGAKVSFPREKT